MGLTKTEHYSPLLLQRAEIFKALGHPARLAIVEHLLAQDRCIAGDLVHELPLAQPTVSRHLRILQSVGFIVGDIEGQSVCYWVNPELTGMLLDYLHQLNEQIQACSQKGCA
ncbi:MAG: ArsR/SmtB family transcription factor [Bacteroidota bacterium]